MISFFSYENVSLIKKRELEFLYSIIIFTQITQLMCALAKFDKLSNVNFFC